MTVARDYSSSVLTRQDQNLDNVYLHVIFSSARLFTKQILGEGQNSFPKIVDVRSPWDNMKQRLMALLLPPPCCQSQSSGRTISCTGAVLVLNLLGKWICGFFCWKQKVLQMSRTRFNDVRNSTAGYRLSQTLRLHPLIVCYVRPGRHSLARYDLIFFLCVIPNDPRFTLETNKFLTIPPVWRVNEVQ